MRKIIETSVFRRDVKRVRKRGRKLEKLFSVVEKLVLEADLPPARRDHALLGDWIGHGECHIEPDWLLIHALKDGFLILTRTGSHSDLFK